MPIHIFSPQSSFWLIADIIAEKIFASNESILIPISLFEIIVKQPKEGIKVQSIPGCKHKIQLAITENLLPKNQHRQLRVMQNASLPLAVKPMRTCTMEDRGIPLIISNQANIDHQR